MVEATYTTKDFTNVCLCGDGYMRVEGSEVEGFLEVLATPRNRKIKKRLLPVYLPIMES